MRQTNSPEVPPTINNIVSQVKAVESMFQQDSNPLSEAAMVCLDEIVRQVRGLELPSNNSVTVANDITIDRVLSVATTIATLERFAKDQITGQSPSHDPFFTITTPSMVQSDPCRLKASDSSMDELLRAVTTNQIVLVSEHGRTIDEAALEIFMLRQMLPCDVVTGFNGVWLVATSDTASPIDLVKGYRKAMFPEHAT